MNGLFNINGAELVVILVVIALVVGPERLPEYSRQLASFVRSAREQLRQIRTRVDEEVGSELGDVDWTALDPRKYDPRRIVREALLDDGPSSGAQPADRSSSATRLPSGSAQGRDERGGSARGGVAHSPQFVPGEPAPYDDEAT